MAWSKRDIIQQALTEIGLADYAFDLEPAQWQSALRRLDAMIAQWENKGIRLAWPLPVSFANSSIDDDSNAPDTALEALYLNLAVRLAPQYGKTPSPDTKSLASTAYKTLLGQSAQPVPMQIDNMAVPAGAGYKYWRGYTSPFLDPPQKRLAEGDDGYLDIGVEP
jgi:hypothetical protein